MPGNSGRVRTALLFQESTFATGPVSWNSQTAFLCIDPDTSGLQQASIENQNYRQRPGATREKVPALRSGSSVPFGLYAHARGTDDIADEAANATTYYLADFLRNAWGGRRLGRCSGLDSGTASAPVLDTGEGASWDSGDWGFFIDATTGRGEFVRVESLSTDTITPTFDLSFTPDAGGADVVGAVIVNYFNWPALVNRSDSDHISHSFLFAGDPDGSDGNDVVSVNGCKLNITGIEGLEAGNAPQFKVEALVTRFTNEALSHPTGIADPVGEAPVVTSTATDTFVRIAAVDASFSGAVEAQSITVTPGVTWQRVTGVGGIEGVFGHTVQGFDDSMLEIVVPFDDAWMSAWEARTQYHVLIQIGVEQGVAIGWYAPRCELAEDPQRTVTVDLASVTLKFRCLEDDRTTTATGDQLELYRSKLVYLASA